MIRSPPGPRLTARWGGRGHRLMHRYKRSGSQLGLAPDAATADGCVAGPFAQRVLKGASDRCYKGGLERLVVLAAVQQPGGLEDTCPVWR